MRDATLSLAAGILATPLHYLHSIQYVTVFMLDRTPDYDTSGPVIECAKMVAEKIGQVVTGAVVGVAIGGPFVAIGLAALPIGVALALITGEGDLAGTSCGLLGFGLEAGWESGKFVSGAGGMLARGITHVTAHALCSATFLSLGAAAGAVGGVAWAAYHGLETACDTYQYLQENGLCYSPRQSALDNRTHPPEPRVVSPTDRSNAGAPDSEDANSQGDASLENCIVIELTNFQESDPVEEHATPKHNTESQPSRATAPTAEAIAVAEPAQTNESVSATTAAIHLTEQTPATRVVERSTAQSMREGASDGTVTSDTNNRLLQIGAAAVLGSIASRFVSDNPLTSAGIVAGATLLHYLVSTHSGSSTNAGDAKDAVTAQLDQNPMSDFRSFMQDDLHFEPTMGGSDAESYLRSAPEKPFVTYLSGKREHPYEIAYLDSSNRVQRKPIDVSNGHLSVIGQNGVPQNDPVIYSDAKSYLLNNVYA